MFITPYLLYNCTNNNDVMGNNDYLMSTFHTLDKWGWGWKTKKGAESWERKTQAIVTSRSW